MNTRLRRLALGCLLPGFDGLQAPVWLLRKLDLGLGGVCFFGRNIGDEAQVARLSAEIGSTRPAALIAIDEEGGDVSRLELATGSSYPGNLALGRAGDTDLTRRVAQAMAARLAAAGINLNLAPVADVNRVAGNPVIGVRSFGADPVEVARHTAAFVDGLQSGGVAACAKHFPGHGDTVVDSHHALPVVEGDARALAAGPLLPFGAAIEAGVKAIMSAHLVLPAYDSVPATVSRRVLTGLLREEMGFGGLILSDGLDMAAIAGTIGILEGAVRSLAAGADGLCVGGGPADEATVDAIAAAIATAVEGGILSEASLLASVGRMTALAGWAADRRPPIEAGDGAGLEAARRALEVRGDIGVGDSALVVQLEPEPGMAAGPMPWGLAGRLGGRWFRLREDSDLSPGRLLDQAGDADLVVVVRDAHRFGWQRDLATALLRARPDLVLVEMGLPAWRPDVSRYLATYGAGRVNGIAAEEALGAGAGGASRRRPHSRPASATSTEASITQ